MARSIADVFDNLRSKKQIALMPFLPAGYPDLQTTVKCVHAVEAAGASLIEVGFPFSDPVADGPVIQEAFTEALQNGVRVSQILDAFRPLRETISTPLLAMLSYSIVHRYGLEKFVADLREAGFAGLILPDLPPPEAQRVCKVIRAGGLDTVLLVAPTTTPQRQAEIAGLCSGFVYYLSVAGITGERDQLPADAIEKIRRLKAVSAAPVCVGFGIHRPEHVRQLRGIADGAIVGTAVVRRMKAHLHEGSDAIARAVGEYCHELLERGD